MTVSRSERTTALEGIVDESTRRDAVEHLLQRVNLWGVRKRRLGRCSGGMKQRVGVAQAILGDPSLIEVDEPTAGLDPACVRGPDRRRVS